MVNPTKLRIAWCTSYRWSIGSTFNRGVIHASCAMHPAGRNFEIVKNVNFLSYLPTTLYHYSQCWSIWAFQMLSIGYFVLLQCGHESQSSWILSEYLVRAPRHRGCLCCVAAAWKLLLGLCRLIIYNLIMFLHNFCMVQPIWSQQTVILKVLHL